MCVCSKYTCICAYCEVVYIILQNCTRVLQSLRAGDFGTCEDVTEDYVKKCHGRFPYASAFKPPSTSAPSPVSEGGGAGSPCENNHIGNELKDNCHSSN